MQAHTKNDTNHTRTSERDVQGATVSGGHGVNIGRLESVQLALELHRGKGNNAAQIVAEAAVFEAYLRGVDPVADPAANTLKPPAA